MIPGIEAGQDHREARERLEAAGWLWHARGDWAQVYRSPDGTRVARVAPFDPAYALHVRTCLAHPGIPYFQRIESCLPLAPAGQLVVMERLDSADPDRAGELCARLGETKFLGHPPEDREHLAWADARCRDPQLRRLFGLLRATAAEGARSLGCFGGLDVRPGNVMQDPSGRLVLVDPYFVAGLRLVPAILEDVEAVGRWYGPQELRGFLEIAAFEAEADEADPVRLRLGERVEHLARLVRSAERVADRVESANGDPGSLQGARVRRVQR